MNGHITILHFAYILVEVVVCGLYTLRWTLLTVPDGLIYLFTLLWGPYFMHRRNCSIRWSMRYI